MEYLHSDLTKKLIKLYFEVYNDLPFGLETEIYRKALLQKLILESIKVEEQKRFPINYLGKEIGEVSFDFLVEEKVAIEVLNKDSFIDEKDIENVRAKSLMSPVEVILIFNFTQELNHKRYFYSNKEKRPLI